MSPQPGMGNQLVVWKRIYITVLAGVFLYLGFWAIDGQLLASQMGNATVIDKEYRKAGTTYRTERIGTTTRVIPYATPDMYILKLRLGNQEARWPVTREFYEKTHIDDQLQVRYEKRRITGSLKIVSIETEVTK
jgi:hypothetical protein